MKDVRRRSAVCFMKRFSTVVLALAMTGFTGCEGLRAAARSKENQGAAIGALVGAGLFAIIQATSHDRSNFGPWTGGGAALGAFFGWCAGYVFDPKNKPKPPPPRAQRLAAQSIRWVVEEQPPGLLERSGWLPATGIEEAARGTEQVGIGGGQAATGAYADRDDRLEPLTNQ